MITLSASLRLRPTRIGFLVDPTDSELLKQIFQVCTCLWGGLYNPIIPVCSEVPQSWRDNPFPTPSPADLANGYIKFFEPDVFVEATAGLAAAIAMQQSKLDFMRPRIIPLSAFFETDAQRRSVVPFGTCVFQIYKDLYDREFKFLRRQEHGIAAIEPDSESALFLNAVFGGFPSQGPLAPIAKAYLDAFDPINSVASAESWVRIIKDGFRLPLSFTMELIKRDPNGWDEPTLFVVDPSSPLDIVDLWNIRQFNSKIFPISLPWLQEAKDFIAEFLKTNYRPLPNNNNGVMIRPTIQFGRSISKERAEDAVQKAGLVGLGDIQWLFKLFYDPIWKPALDSDHVVRPQRASISASTSDLELMVSNSGDDLRSQFTGLSPPFADTYDDAGNYPP
jgi:hypothetical protein